MLSIDISMLVVFIIVWILLAVLTKLFYKPLRRIMDKRKSVMEGRHTASSTAREEYRKAVEQIEKSIQAAKSDAVATRNEFEQKALQEKGQMIAEISEECRKQIEEAKVEIDKKVKIVKKELEEESKTLAEKIEKRVLN